MPSTRLVIGAAVSSLLIAGCGGGAAEENGGAAEEEAEATNEEEAQDSQEDALDVSVSAEFGPYAEDAEAVTYDEEAVPEGADVEVSVTEEDGGSEYSLTVSGLEANRELGSHLHTEPCGEDPADSGPHYQNEADPEADAENPSTDPAYANPENEVWLDFTTDENGNAEQEAEVDWIPREGEANSVVLHEEHTSEEEGSAGEAGDRLACVNVAL